jgi:hypothetical protein
MTAINVSGARRIDRCPNVTGRDNYILMQALGYAIEAIGRLPERWQEWSNREDMIKLLAAMSDNPDFYRLVARAHLERRGLIMKDGQLVLKDRPPGVVVGMDGVVRCSSDRAETRSRTR